MEGDTENTPESPEFHILPTIVHSGHFHADEVMAVAMLDLLGLLKCDEHSEHSITRTRDPIIIKKKIGKAYILDVGQHDDPDNLLFDHHQKGFDRYFSEHAQELGVRMSSCGLLYKFLGPSIFVMFINRYMTSSTNPDVVKNRTYPTDEQLRNWHEHFYNKYIMEIDANDNGVSQLKDVYDNIGENEVFRYSRYWNLSNIVGAFNNTNTADTGKAAEAQDKSFLKAVTVCRNILKQYLYHFITERKAHEKSLVKIKGILHYSASNSSDFDQLGSYMNVIGNAGVLLLNKKFDYTGAANEILYKTNELVNGLVNGIPEEFKDTYWSLTILPREDGKNDPDNDNWQIHTVNIAGKRFQHRVSILDFDSAKQVIGDNLVFVHNARFIAVTKGRQAACDLAIASIRKHERERKQREQREQRAPEEHQAGHTWNFQDHCRTWLIEDPPITSGIVVIAAIAGIWYAWKKD